jgi:hypothetical protein
MLVTIGIAKLPDGGIRVEVQKPQSCARAERHYADVRDVRRALCNFALPTDAIEYFLKLLPEIEENQLLSFPPLDIPQHQLAEEGLGVNAVTSLDEVFAIGDGESDLVDPFPSAALQSRVD